MADSAAASAARVFISYRREETAWQAGWLFDRLVDRVGRGQIFKDIESIELGDDFVEVITTAVGSCDVLLALIGERWLTITGDQGRARLDDPGDFVRLEIEAALTRNVRVIPILVGGARLPRADQLPPSLAKLARRQALELSPSHFELDTSRLHKVLDRALADVHAQPVEQLQRQIREHAAAQDWAEAIKFLYGQAGEALRSWRERKAGISEAGALADELIVAELPGSAFEGQLSEPRLHFTAVARLEQELSELRKAVGDYAQGTKEVDPDNRQLLETVNGLRRAMEAVYGQRLTFRGEAGPSSGVEVVGEAKVDEVLGYVAGLRAKRITAGSVTGRVEAKTVKPGAEAVGLDIGTIGGAGS